jgi:chemotaxis protein CheC
MEDIHMGSFSLDSINEMCMDVLKEIGNIGAGNATTAIASMINAKINMAVPKVELMEASKLGSAICPEDETIVGIFLEVTNDITGSMMFLMRMDAAHYLVNRLMGAEREDNEPFNEMELSAMKEIGNIIAGAYLSALANMTNLVISPSIPYISVDMAAAILSVPAIQFGQYGDNALLIETEFGDDVMINGYFILMPDQESYSKILSSLGVVL